MADANIEITAITDQARAELGKLSEQVDGLKAGAEGLGSSGASGIDKFTGAMERVGSALVIVQSLGTIIQSLGKGINELTENGLIEADAETKAWTGSLEDLGKSLVRLDPVGVGAALGQVLGGAIVDVTDATRTFTEVNKEAADSLSFMGLEGQKASDRLRSVMQVQREWIAAQEKAATTAAIRSEAITRQIAIEQQSGAVTKAARDEVKKLLDTYEKLGQDAPPSLQAVADKLGILSTSQEKAADAAAKAAEKLAKENEKLAEQAAKHDTLIPKLKEFADGKKAGTAAIDDAVRALKEEISLLEQEAKAAEGAAKSAQGKLQDASKRRAELEGKSVLSVEEAEELLDLQLQTSQLQADAANTAEDAAQKAFEYGEAQSELAGATDDAAGSLDSFASSGDYVAQVNRELEQSSAQLGKALSDMGGEAASANEIVETIGENGERKFSNVTEAAGEFGDVLVQVGEDGQYVMESIERGTEGVAQAAPAAADGIAQVGDELRNLPDDKDDTGLGKAKSDSEALANTLLPRILELCKEIKKEAGGITLGGGGAGI